ncbi:MAG: hypothetical protein LH629_10805 [Ignavibacteria bacterium]|nr:hypothetical protein [Ignavibacteria bacterium]
MSLLKSYIKINIKSKNYHSAVAGSQIFSLLIAKIVAFLKSAPPSQSKETQVNLPAPKSEASV